ncbi:hypothetical protein CORC01_10800 [Colletotrichum orchidophilum]|uniref:Uncharacterized protein n=1 Tax=Colletotrichum orchidophilum TaxID=1209926 RepID=A0A1G4AXP6_9PEZI|nr:uncharacterized protein CORC01_10800 [Colletotrichum orchidophilum]OHE93901.1 hypothetical protein CORC01_10800 [Colletotrichum orchidophilum]
MFVTPLGYAAASGQLSVVYTLLELGEDVDSQHRDGGSTALFLALYGGHESLATLLLEKGASTELAFGYHPLHAAARNGFNGIIADLITTHGVDPNIPDCDGAVPAVYALLQEQDKALATLLQLKSHGASLDMTLDGTERPLTLDNVAVALGKMEVLCKARQAKDTGVESSLAGSGCD